MSTAGNRAHFALKRISVAGSTLLVVLATAFLLSSWTSGRTAVAEQPGAAAEALTSLNEASRAAYSRAKDSILANTGPVILVEGENLVLKKREPGSQEEGR